MIFSTAVGAAMMPPPSPHDQSITITGNKPPGGYVAMGDSIAAGAGLPSDGSGCGRSLQAYPNQVARSKSLSLTNLACSGATTTDVLDSQLDRAFSNGTPKLITMTVGANDMRWMEFVGHCRGTSQCGTRVDDVATSILRHRLENQYRDIFADILQRSGNLPPQVVVTGYSNPISNYCKGRQDVISSKEIDWLNKQRDELNKTIRRSMKGFPFVKYASTNFNGHALCAPDSWVQGVSDPAPLHPNSKGQELIAKSVLQSAF